MVQVVRTAASMLAVVVLLGLLPACTKSKQIKLTASASHAPVVPFVKVIHEHVVPESVKRAKALGYEIKWTESYSGSLYDYKNTLDGIQNGLGDLGWVGTLWEPAKLPMHNVSYFFPFVAMDSHTATLIQEEMHETIPALREYWEKYNQVYLGGQALDSYVLLTNFPVKKLEDLKGKKIYCPGAVANWVKGVGAVGVDGALPVYYNGIQTGITSGVIIPGSTIVPYKLYEVAPYITIAGFGSMISGALTMNKDTFEGLPKELQQMFRDLGKEYALLVDKHQEAGRKKHFEEVLPQKGVTITTLPLAEQKKWAASMTNLMDQWSGSTKGQISREVLKAWVEGARKRGSSPLRDWDKEM